MVFIFKKIMIGFSYIIVIILLLYTEFSFIQRKNRVVEVKMKSLKKEKGKIRNSLVSFMKLAYLNINC